MTAPLSNANANYINSLISNAQNNIKTEKELQTKLAQAPAPSVTQTKTKTDNNAFYKGMAALAVGGTLLIQGISLINRPDKTQGENFAKLSEAIDKIVEDIGKLQTKLNSVADEQTKTQNKVNSIDLSEIQKQLKELAKAVKEGKIDEAQLIIKIKNIINGNNGKLNASLEEIVKKYTKEIIDKMPTLEGIEESLEQIKTQLSKPNCDVSKELAQIKATLDKMQSPKEILASISELKTILEKQPKKEEGVKDLVRFGAKVQEAESLKKIYAQLEEIKTLLSKIEPAKMPTEELAEIKTMLQKLDALGEVSKELGNLKICSETILQRLNILGDDISQKLSAQKEGITEIKSAITRMLNGAMVTPKTTQVINEATAPSIDIDLIAKVISSQAVDSSGIDKIQIDYQELIELLKDKTYGQNFEYIAAKFDELVQSVQELNSTNPKQRLTGVYTKLQEALAKAKKEKSLTTDTIFKHFFTPVEQINFSKGEARLKTTGEKFSGTIVSYEKLREFDFETPTPTGSRFLMTYADGQLVRSTKYDVKGDEIFKKVYSYDVKPQKDSTEFHTKIKTIRTNFDGSKEMSSFQNIDTRSDSDNRLLRKRFNKMIIDFKNKKANEVTRYNEEFGTKTLYRETPEGNFVTIIGKDKKVHTLDFVAPFEKVNKNVNGLATSFIKMLSEDELNPSKKPGFLSGLFNKADSK